jgi:hypothetical protein
MPSIKEILDKLPKCENCKEKPMVLAFMDNEETELPSYGMPPWCKTCLDDVDWQEYWQRCAKGPSENKVIT